ncbi:MAG: L,D-transpeptidase [Myxococcota bacterium]
MVSFQSNLTEAALFLLLLTTFLIPVVNPADKNRKPFFISWQASKRTRLYLSPRENSQVVTGVVTKNTRLALVKKLPKKSCNNGFFAKFGKELYGCSSNFAPSLAFPGGTPYFPKNFVSKAWKYYRRTKQKNPLYSSEKTIKSRKPAFFLPQGAYVSFFFKKYKKIQNKLFLYNKDHFLLPFANTSYTPFKYFKGKKYSPSKYIRAVVVANSGAGIFQLPSGRRISLAKRYTWLELIPKQIKKHNGNKYFKVRQGGWVKEARVKRFFLSPPPDLIKPESNHTWIEIILSQQTLVAYRGNSPIYLTLVSTGKRSSPTPTGIFRIFYKRSGQNIEAKKGKNYLYSFAKVPYLQFFKKKFAFHSAYWHNLFGHPSSMGCVELSPVDSKFLYEFTLPRINPGFMARAAGNKSPGTLVRIVNFQGEAVNIRFNSRFLKYF